MGTGEWLRGQTEHCMLAVRGKPVFLHGNHTTVLEAATVVVYKVDPHEWWPGRMDTPHLHPRAEHGDIRARHTPFGVDPVLTIRAGRSMRKA